MGARNIAGGGGMPTNQQGFYLRHGKRGFALLKHPSVPLGNVLLPLHFALPLSKLSYVPRDFVVLATARTQAGKAEGGTVRRA